MHLALIGVFRARWSADVHEEWISNLLANRPDLTRERLECTRQLMDKAAPDALDESSILRSSTSIRISGLQTTRKLI